MKLKFDANLSYQAEAVQAVVDVFDGQPLSQSDFEISFTEQVGMVEQTELGLGNRLALDDDQLLTNVHKVQTRNEIEPVDELKGRQFSVEMETGTGKTYVYLRTIFELNQKYGFKKFIIVVPSVAIREGTLKNLQVTEEHFKALYDKVPFNYYVYDSSKVSQLRQFATSNQIQILIINIDAFRKIAVDADDKTGNVIHRDNDRLSGRKPIEFIQATNPIVIVDEPQSVDSTEKAQEAMATLNPLCTLRYSATHRNPYNLLYKLDPIRAYDMKLVKRIEVASVMSEENLNKPYICLVDTDNKNGIKAKLKIHTETKGGAIKEKAFWFKQGDDLSAKPNARESYQDGYIVRDISCEPGNEHVVFNNGNELYLNEEQGGMRDEIMQVQVRNTVEEHFKKERAVRGKGVKVLTLFFIDKVANYRDYDDQGNARKGKIAQWFEEAFAEFSEKPPYKGLVPHPVEKVHDGYFSQDNKGQLKDTRGNTKADDSTYELIMKKKEQLLSLEEPLRFIFSHSALREGWDNPNVFQICTLNETNSKLKKRQEIGRGLRLPVNQDGERVHDETVNRLTVIANESYEDFARGLQTELEEDFGFKFGHVPKHAFAKILWVKDGKQEQVGQKESQNIWEDALVNGYIDKAGKLQPKFAPKEPSFEMKVSSEHEDIRSEIVDAMQRFEFRGRIVNKSDRRTLKLNKRVYFDPEFAELWCRINQQTAYSVEYSTAELIQKAAKVVSEMPKIEAVKIVSGKGELSVAEGGIDSKVLTTDKTTYVTHKGRLPDLLAYLQKETELTRKTLFEILAESGRLAEFPVNPQRYMMEVARLINVTLNHLVLDGIKYEKIGGEVFEMRLFEEEEIVRYLENLIESEKSVYDCVEFDSEVERQFAEDLNNMEEIKLFVKLPSKFQIKTPIGPYNPDWAIVKHGDETIYMVRETKGTKDMLKLRPEEAYKIRCGKQHFEALGDKITYEVVTSAREI